MSAPRTRLRLRSRIPVAVLKMALVVKSFFSSEVLRNRIFVVWKAGTMIGSRSDDDLDPEHARGVYGSDIYLLLRLPVVACNDVPVEFGEAKSVATPQLLKPILVNRALFAFPGINDV